MFDSALDLLVVPLQFLLRFWSFDGSFLDFYPFSYFSYCSDERLISGLLIST